MNGSNLWGLGLAQTILLLEDLGVFLEILLDHLQERQREILTVKGKLHGHRFIYQPTQCQVCAVKKTHTEDVVAVSLRSALESGAAVQLSYEVSEKFKFCHHRLNTVFSLMAAEGIKNKNPNVPWSDRHWAGSGVWVSRAADRNGPCCSSVGDDPGTSTASRHCPPRHRDRGRTRVIMVD